MAINDDRKSEKSSTDFHFAILSKHNHDANYDPLRFFDVIGLCFYALFSLC